MQGCHTCHQSFSLHSGNRAGGLALVNICLDGDDPSVINSVNTAEAEWIIINTAEAEWIIIFLSLSSPLVKL